MIWVKVSYQTPYAEKIDVVWSLLKHDQLALS